VGDRAEQAGEVIGPGHGRAAERAGGVSRRRPSCSSRRPPVPGASRPLLGVRPPPPSRRRDPCAECVHPHLRGLQTPAPSVSTPTPEASRPPRRVCPPPPSRPRDPRRGWVGPHLRGPPEASTPWGYTRSAGLQGPQPSGHPHPRPASSGRRRRGAHPLGRPADPRVRPSGTTPGTPEGPARAVLTPRPPPRGQPPPPGRRCRQRQGRASTRAPGDHLNRGEDRV
jgi:hypothetical protein